MLYKIDTLLSSFINKERNVIFIWITFVMCHILNVKVAFSECYKISYIDDVILLIL